MHENFENLGVKIAVISTDDLTQHNLWVEHLEQIDYRNRGPQKIKFPVFEDAKGISSRLYGMLHEPVSTTNDVRGVFIIDPQNIVRSINFYPMEVGRNIEEIGRTVIALQTSDKDKVLTPANWKQGEDVMVPYYQYTNEQLVENPGLKNQYYDMGNRMWFKKVDN